MTRDDVLEALTRLIGQERLVYVQCGLPKQQQRICFCGGVEKAKGMCSVHCERKRRLENKRVEF